MRTRTIYAGDGKGGIKAEYVNGECTFYAGEQEPVGDAAYVVPDIAPFVANTGEYIAGRKAWRAHLQKVDGIEMGASDIAAQERQWKQRKEAHRERLRSAEKVVKEVEIPHSGRPIAPQQLSRLNVEILNRLHGRPAPERKELIKMTLDQAKRMGLK